MFIRRSKYKELVESRDGYREESQERFNDWVKALERIRELEPYAPKQWPDEIGPWWAAYKGVRQVVLVVRYGDGEFEVTTMDDCCYRSEDIGHPTDFYKCEVLPLTHPAAP